MIGSISVLAIVFIISLGIIITIRDPNFRKWLRNRPKWFDV